MGDSSRNTINEPMTTISVRTADKDALTRAILEESARQGKRIPVYEYLGEIIRAHIEGKKG